MSLFDHPMRRRLVAKNLEATSGPLTILVDGEPIAALAGDSIAAALLAAGISTIGAYPDNSTRGLSCGMGACQTCLVTIDGGETVRACMTPVVNGMRISTGGAEGPAKPHHHPSSEDIKDEQYDVVVIGAGPAGMRAATILAKAGLQTLVLDERASPGGQYFKPLASSHRFIKKCAADKQFRRGLCFTEEFETSGVEYLDQATVWSVEGIHGHLYQVTYDRHKISRRVSGRAILLATGATETAWPVPGWTLPGAMTTGAAQTLARSYRVAPGTRTVICGNGPLNLQVAAELAAGGIPPVAVVEASPHPLRSMRAGFGLIARRPDHAWDGIKYLTRLAVAGTEIHNENVLIRIEGTSHVEAAIIAQIDSQGSIIPNTKRRIPADCVTMGYGFQPSNELARLLGCEVETQVGNPGRLVLVRDNGGRTSRRGVYVAGDCTTPHGAAIAIADGEIAASSIMSDMSAIDAPSPVTARRVRGQELRFQQHLWRTFAAQLPQISELMHEETIICRCESVRRKDIDPLLPSASLAEIKRVTRCGMGLCQGRYCFPLLARLGGAKFAEEASKIPRAQIPLKPISIASMASLELLQNSTAPAILMPSRVETGPETVKGSIDCDDLVVGGGIIGLFTALELAIAGRKVVLLEASHHTGSQASGANAGSLHVQSLAYAFSDLDSRDARAAFQMLRLQRDSASAWLEFERKHQLNLEIGQNGGLCVAQTQADMERLAYKTKIEREVGIDVRIIDGDEARKMIPGLSSSIIAASFSPDEGKLNPLIAIPAVTQRARAAGVQILTNTPARTITRKRGQYEVHAGEWKITAQTLTLSAGTGTGSLAEQLGTPLEITATPLQMIVTQRLDPIFAELLSHVTDRLTMKQSKSGNVIIGGGWRAERGPDGNPNISPHLLAANLRVAQSVYPGLTNAQIIRSWVTENARPSQGPVIGTLPNAPGACVAVALNGMTLGPVLGKICADIAIGREPKWDISAFDPGNGRTTI